MTTIRRPWQWALLVAFILALYTLPLYASQSLVSLVNRIGISIIAVQGLNLLTGYTGQISLGQAAFMTTGGYISALLVSNLGWSFVAALPVAALGAGLIGLLFGLPSLRVKGFYLVMATLAAQFIIRWMVQVKLDHLTKGYRPLEVPDVKIGTWKLGDGAIYYLIVVTTILSMIAARNIIRTRTGRAFVSIRDNDLAAELLGINVFTYKLRAFFLCAVYAGLAGGLLAVESGSIKWNRFDLNNSVEYLAMLIIGGAGFPQAAFFGVGFILVLKEVVIPEITPFLREFLPQILTFVDQINIDASLTPTLFGLAVILFLIFEPRGLAHRWEIFRIWWKLRPFSQH